MIIALFFIALISSSLHSMDVEDQRETTPLLERIKNSACCAKIKSCRKAMGYDQDGGHNPVPLRRKIAIFCFGTGIPAGAAFVAELGYIIFGNSTNGGLNVGIALGTGIYSTFALLIGFAASTRWWH